MKIFLIAGALCLLFIFIGAKEMTALFSKASSSRSAITHQNQAAQDYADMLISRASK